MHSKEWQTSRIDQLGDILGGRQRSPHLTKGRPRPYLRVANVFDGEIDTSDIKCMPFTDQEFQTFRLEPGDILLNEGQSLELVGRSAIYSGEPPDCCFQNTLIRFRPRDANHAQFFQALFRFLRENRRFEKIAVQTTSIAHLGAGRFAALRVSCPSSGAERLAIGATANGWEDVLSHLAVLIQAKYRLKGGLMQQLLTGQRRFKEFDEETWLDRHLGDVFRERVEIGRSDLPLLSITAHRGVVRRDDLDRRDSSNADKSKYLRITPGDIGYNTMRMWQGVSALSTLEGIVSPAYTICEPGPDIHGPFAAHLFKLPAVIDRFRRNSQGLVDDTLNLKFHHFAQIRVSIPRVDEQRAIAGVLTALDGEIEILERLREALDRQRRGVMELLLTGRVRVPA